MKRTPVQAAKLSKDQVQDIRDAVFATVEKNLDDRFYLLDVAFEKEAGAWFLRIYTEGCESPISLNDCEAISRQLDPVLEEHPALEDLSYSLEVSSPGAFRPLKTQREFDFFQGRPVRIEEEASPTKKGKAKPAPIPLKPQDGLLQSVDLENRQVTLRKADSEELFTVPLQENQVVLLSPILHFPDDSESSGK